MVEDSKERNDASGNAGKDRAPARDRASAPAPMRKHLFGSWKMS